MNNLRILECEQKSIQTFHLDGFTNYIPNNKIELPVKAMVKTTISHLQAVGCFMNFPIPILNEAWFEKLKNLPVPKSKNHPIIGWNYGNFNNQEDQYYIRALIP